MMAPANPTMNPQTIAMGLQVAVRLPQHIRTALVTLYQRIDLSHGTSHVAGDVCYAQSRGGRWPEMHSNPFNAHFVRRPSKRSMTGNAMKRRFIYPWSDGCAPRMDLEQSTQKLAKISAPSVVRRSQRIVTSTIIIRIPAKNESSTERITLNNTCTWYISQN